MKSSRLLSILLTSGFLFSIQGTINEAMWKVKETGKRYTLPGSGIVSMIVSRIICGSTCLLRQDCISFNHNEATWQCELLNTAYHKPSDQTLVTASGWNYYNFLPPRPPKNASDYCANGGTYVQYEQPVYLRYNYALDGYTCSPHSWVKAQADAGKTCKMVIMYDTDFIGQDSAFTNRPVTYYEAAKLCMTYNCIGMICRKHTATCWLKINTQFTSSTMTSAATDLNFWYTVCE
ncbi:uncharacterized protein [Palaemon carinicauda]|uniref:uncharacterized protein n=1 Tax=Palaemon carinicauda TaxID=392227 RepID=UPI0035B60199